METLPPGKPAKQYSSYKRGRAVWASTYPRRLSENAYPSMSPGRNKVISGIAIKSIISRISAMINGTTPLKIVPMGTRVIP